MNSKKKSIRVILVSMVMFLVPMLSTTVLPGQTFEKMKDGVKEKTLENGMKFIVLERHEAPVVSFHVYADVGSAQESYGITGISHLLEHMAFKGTKVVGTKDYKAEAPILDKLDALYDKITLESQKIKPDNAALEKMQKEFEELRQKAKELVITNDYLNMMRQEGDNVLNAYTNNDATQYINGLPSNRLEFWMAMTSDRFMNPVFREFYKERDVVMEERRLGIETRPMGKLFEDFMAMAFKSHPYRHGVIGHMSDLKRITRKDVKDYFAKYYSPCNLTAAIVGDVKADEVFKMAELYFGRIPGGTKPDPLRTVEPEQWGERHVTISAQAQPTLVIGYHRPASTHEDDTALEALANIIGQGRSSRLYELLIKEKRAAVACTSFNGWPDDKYPNLIAFYTIPSKDHTSAECLELIETGIEKIKTGLVTPDELTKYKQTAKKRIIDRMQSNSRMAAMLTYYDVVHGDWQLTFDQLKNIDDLTAEQIKAAACKYLVKNNRTVGEIIPEKSGEKKDSKER
jgi:predicted Zn-dependent peptidase